MEEFEFNKLFPNLQWEIIMKMDDRELVNLCRSSKEMENFCNTRDWFWKFRVKHVFGLDRDDLVDLIKGGWFRVYFTLIKLNKLRQKLSPHLDRYNLLQLYYLKSLDLSVKRLTELPKEIGVLTNLERLYLSRNLLTDLPEELGQLSNLYFLYLDYNQLTNLPKEIGNLTNLRALYLDNNQLTDIPSEIGNLTNLQYLYLGNNQLTDIPKEISNLTYLNELHLGENPLISLNDIKKLLPNTFIRK